MTLLDFVILALALVGACFVLWWLAGGVYYCVASFRLWLGYRRALRRALRRAAQEDRIRAALRGQP
jgi:hypothetical protein